MAVVIFLVVVVWLIWMSAKRKFRRWAREMEKDPARMAAFVERTQRFSHAVWYDSGYKAGRNNGKYDPTFVYKSGDQEKRDAYDHGFEAGYEYRKQHP
jgi:hypothetical protein